MTKLNKLIIISLLILTILSTVFANEQNNSVNAYLFYGETCPHCHEFIKYIEENSNQYPNLILNKYEVYNNQTNRELGQRFSSAYNTTFKAVPTIFIGNKVILGFNNQQKGIFDAEYNKCSQEECQDPKEKLTSNNNHNNDKNTLNKITIPAVILAALVDAINPCAFAVLIILLTTILATKNKKRALYAGFAFASSIFISYYLMGIGLYSAVNATSISNTLFYIVAILAIILGLFNLKDCFWYGKFFVMEVPRSWRPKMKTLIKGITSIPGAFGIGFIISLFLLPCTSGPYVVILGMLSKITTRNEALILLILYNLIFISPMILITLGIYFGLTTTEKAETIRVKYIKILHLIAGIILLTLGIFMILSLKFGLI